MKENTLDKVGTSLADCLSLSLSLSQIPHEIGQRLKLARHRALESHRKINFKVTAMSHLARPAGSSIPRSRHGAWWKTLALGLPVVTIVIGAYLFSSPINTPSKEEQVASVDTHILASGLPTNAYTDPGFVQYVSNQIHAQSNSMRLQ